MRESRYRAPAWTLRRLAISGFIVVHLCATLLWRRRWVVIIFCKNCCSLVSKLRIANLSVPRQSSSVFTRIPWNSRIALLLASGRTDPSNTGAPREQCQSCWTLSAPHLPPPQIASDRPSGA